MARMKQSEKKIDQQANEQPEKPLAGFKLKLKKYGPKILAGIALIGSILIACKVSSDSDNDSPSHDNLDIDEPPEEEASIYGVTQSRVSEIARDTYHCDDALINEHGGVDLKWHTNSGKTHYTTTVQIEGMEHAVAYTPVGPRENHSMIPGDFARKLQAEIDMQNSM